MASIGRGSETLRAASIYIYVFFFENAYFYVIKNKLRAGAFAKSLILS